MPKGVYKHKTGNSSSKWKGGKPVCENCKKQLSQYRSPSAIKRGVKNRCSDCFIKEVKSKAEISKVCVNGCGSSVSRKGHMCRDCFWKLSKGVHKSPKTEWKPGNIPKSHLRSNFGNKFNVARKEDRTYGGEVYHSKMESQYANYLDLLKKSGEIKDWGGQHPFKIKIKGKHISTYFCDFKVITKTGEVEYHEVKGFATDLYLLKKKLVELLFEVKIKEIKKFKL